MQKLIRRLHSTLTILALVMLAGCAFGTRHPTLIYPPETKSDEAVTTQKAPNNVHISIGAISDKRADKNVVGLLRNMYGMPTADVVPTNSVADWVTQGLEIELRNSGYDVATGSVDDEAPAGVSAVVSGDILKVFSDVYMSYTGEVSLLLNVSSSGKEVLNRVYTGEGSAGIAWFGTSVSYAQSLSLGLAAVLKEFVTELDSVMTTP